LKFISIVGARPQFIKAACVGAALKNVGHQEILVHTGQHYDDNMSKVFFEELNLKKPDVDLKVGSGPHGWQTARMLMGVEEVLLKHKPDRVLVYGDTNSTLAGSLAAVKLQIPLAHIEAGLRSYNPQMPEEHNRKVSDHLADLLFCPTPKAVQNLSAEGINHGIYLVGDVMYDSVLQNIQQAENKSRILEKLCLNKKSYALATVHRAENTDNQDRLASIFKAFEQIAADGIQVVIPLHPRTRNKIEALRISVSGPVLIEPVPYLDMLLLEQNARIILTDSGGIQKEAYFFNVPCVTLREETEWLELVEKGYNMLAGSNSETIYNSCQLLIEKSFDFQADLYGGGQAAKKIINIIKSNDTQHSDSK
jgi:UDP-N-acetylglucosamine 2-epimerase